VKKALGSLAVLAGLSALGFSAAANISSAPAIPSSRLSTEVDVKPVDGQPGRFLVTSRVTDLENGAVVAQPRMLIAADQPASFQTGKQGRWTLRIAISADGASRKASYESTFTREGEVVSKQQLAIDLNG